MLVVGYGSDLLLLHHPALMSLDDILLGILTGVAVYAYEQRAERGRREQARLTHEIHGYVQNELRIIAVALHDPDLMRRVAAVQDCMREMDTRICGTICRSARSGDGARPC